MSQADMQMVRTHVPGEFNLAVGEPIFLQEVYGPLYASLYDGPVRYPLLNGEPELLWSLKKRFSGQYIVVTNGAKQAILAALYALSMTRADKRTVKGFPSMPYDNVVHDTPYWPSYPTLAKMSGMGFETKGNFAVGNIPDVRILTSPNNPDGHQEFKSNRQWDIWDSAYASPIYGWDYIVPWHRISVWSAAKLFGLSGYRIGWLATADPELARLASEYVEKTTSGVSVVSQQFLGDFLKRLAMKPGEAEELQQRARKMLLDTGTEFMALEKHFSVIEGLPTSKSGMFAWVQAKNPDSFKALIGKAKVKMIDGKYCGVEDGWFRVSMGVTPQAMRDAVQAIKEVEHGRP